MASIGLLGVLLTTLLFFYTLILRFRKRPVESHEPTYLQPKVPFVGHAIGLWQHGGAYYSKIRYVTNAIPPRHSCLSNHFYSAKHGLPIYTMPLPSSKFYVINSLPLISSVSKLSKKIAFTPFVKFIAERVAGLPAESVAKFESTGEGIPQETLDAVRGALLGKSESVDLGSTVLLHIQELLYSTSDHVGRPMKLFAWVRHVITQTNTRTIYGPKNPFQQPGVEDAFWTFGENFGLFMVEMVPNVFKKQAIAARDKVAEAFLQYYRSNGQEMGSPLARARYSVPSRHGLSQRDAARLELSFNFAVLHNASTVLFWVLSHVYSQTEVLADLRVEVQKIVVRNTNHGEGAEGTTEFEISLADLKQRCPLLLSVFHEVLRVYNLRPNFRLTLEDVMLEDRYFLEKGTVVQLVTKSVHQDSSYWGPDAKSFNLRRFHNQSSGIVKKTTSFGAFGLAPHICPGRHFAATEIMAIVAQMLVRYDMSPVARSHQRGAWQIPEQDSKGFDAVPGPARDMEVVLTEREEWGGTWNLVSGDPDLKFMLASG